MFDLVDPDCCGPGCQHSCHQLIWDADLSILPARGGGGGGGGGGAIHHRAVS